MTVGSDGRRAAGARTTLPAVAHLRAPVRSGRSTSRGAKRRDAIVGAAADLFARHGYPAVGMDEIGAAAGVTGPAIYRHFESKAQVLAAVIDTIIDAVASDEIRLAESASPCAELSARIEQYAAGVAGRRELMAIFVREVHHLPQDQAAALRQRQRDLVVQWRDLLGAVHPSWSRERVRTSVHAVFGMLNAVGTFSSPLTDAELAVQLTGLARAALTLTSPGA